MENAIRHGIALRTEPGQLALRATRHEGQLLLAIENDGLTGAAPVARGVGHANVEERLAHLYPGEHRFLAQAGEGGRFTVHIELPWRAVAEA